MRFISLILATVMICCSAVHAKQFEQLWATYRETRGSQQGTFSWELVHGEELSLTTGDSEETFRTRLAPDLQTLAWEITRAARQTHIKAWRDGATLIIRGTLEGTFLERTVDLGDLPWLQALSVSLLRHFPEGTGQEEFWMLHPETLEPYRMQVADVRRELQEYNGNPVDTWHVEIRPAGIWASFWRGDYWFRQSDRRFLRYRGASGPPGSPMTEITLFEENGNRAQAEAISPR